MEEIIKKRDKGLKYKRKEWKCEMQADKDESWREDRGEKNNKKKDGNSKDKYNTFYCVGSETFKQG
jgi:hypothetical protein